MDFHTFLRSSRATPLTKHISVCLPITPRSMLVFIRGRPALEPLSSPQLSLGLWV